MLAESIDQTGKNSVYTVMSQDCLDILAHGQWSRQGIFNVSEYEVQLSGGETLYRSDCFDAIQHFITMLTEPCRVMFPC